MYHNIIAIGPFETEIAIKAQLIIAQVFQLQEKKKKRDYK